MNYRLDLPRAVPADFAEVLRRQNPLVGVDERLAELAAIQAWATAEERKWSQARSAFEAFGDPQNPAEQENGEEPVVNAGTNGAAPMPVTRRLRVLAILRSEPQRTWRTGEIGDELHRRGWTGGSAHEMGKVSAVLTDLDRDGTVTRIEKGVYKLRAPEGGEP